MPNSKRIPILVVLAAAVLDSFVILLKGLSVITGGSLLLTVILLGVLLLTNK